MTTPLKIAQKQFNNFTSATSLHFYDHVWIQLGKNMQTIVKSVYKTHFLLPVGGAMPVTYNICINMIRSHNQTLNVCSRYETLPVSLIST